MKNRQFMRCLSFVNKYVLTFLLVAFVVTCCMMLFLSILIDTLSIPTDSREFELAARLTFGNVVLLSLLLTTMEVARRRLAINRPVSCIAKAANELAQGDFSVRIPTEGLMAADSRFGEIAECFNRMAEELGSLETLRTDFVANVSHEMKTPLSVIQNYGTLLMSPAIKDEDRIAYAGSIVDTTRRLSDMMSNVLRLNRLENQEIFPTVRPFDVGDLLMQSILQYEDVIEKKDISLVTNIREGVTVCTDPELLSLVYNNLLSNAFKFTDQGGEVEVSLEVSEKTVTVHVRDTGCGISSEVGAHIFEKFYQGDPSRATQGNGLGLALVRRVLDIMQGEISVESVVGEGSTFTVNIPREAYREA